MFLEARTISVLRRSLQRDVRCRNNSRRRLSLYHPRSSALVSQHLAWGSHSCLFEEQRLMPRCCQIDDAET
jgi:hypothetical protein